MEKLTLLTDQPLGEGNALENDGLGFKSYAEVLGNAALGTPGPFTIGIFGEWGTGKTSLMKMLEDYLAEDKDVITVWFNAWRYEKEEHPIVPLIATIIRGIELKKGLLEKLGETGKSLIRALRAVAYGFSSKAKIKIPGFAELEAGFVAKDMIERYEHLSPDPLLDRSLYFEAFETLSKVKLGKNHRIVVIIDDLDRCFPDLAIKLLESIKLVLSQPGFIFILGVSRRVIEGYLQHRYQKDYGIEDFTGHTYLDKIVQLPFHIPPHSGRMETFSKTLLQRIEESDRKILEEILPIIGVACGNNPRSTVRFINNLLIDRGIDKTLSTQEEEMDIGYFAVSRSLQQRWPDVFSLLSTSDQLCYALSEWKDNAINEEENEKAENKEIAKILSSDPDLKD